MHNATERKWGLVINMTYRQDCKSKGIAKERSKKIKMKGGKRANKTNKLLNEWLKSKYGRIAGEQIF